MVGPTLGAFGTSRFVDGRELILALQSRDGRSSDRAQSCATCPSLIERPRTYSAILWARIPDAFGTSRFVDGRELILGLQSRDGRSSDRAQSCATCPSLIGRPRTYSAILWARIPDAFGTSRFVDGRELILALQSRDGRSSDRAQSCATCPSLIGRPRTYSAILWARFLGAFASRVSRLGGGDPCSSKSRWAKWRPDLIRRHVSRLDRTTTIIS
jgi:hypothetical protein